MLARMEISFRLFGPFRNGFGSSEINETDFWAQQICYGKFYFTKKIAGARLPTGIENPHKREILNILLKD